MQNSSLAAIICCSFVLVASGAAQEHHPEHPWDYSESKGPSHWGDLKPEYAACKNGHRQSPIDIRNPQKASLPPIQFDYKPSSLHIIDNGHTIMINYGPGSFITVGGKRYALKQFHFHRPSEETINGKGYEMVVHLVHADQEGKLAVVAVLLQKGEDNPLVHELWNDWPREKEKEEALDSVQVDVAGLLPADRGYYTYSGSLTTPPCSEDVTWIVLKTPLTVSAAEIQQFSKLYRHDSRPTQPLYGRVVLESK
jgi:carbonic anhydrase